MISLHSCFVAGLTTIYCLWRSPALFGYDILEATQACSQSLTIFGEKWTGAVKYRDIFDTLSGNLVKGIVGSKRSSGSLNMDAAPVTEEQRKGGEAHSNTLETDSGEYHPEQNQEFSEVSMSQMISDAVEEAFMEVDEEAPGGWQGWRMWTEMMGGGLNSIPHETENSWDYQTQEAHGNDPSAENGWDFGNMSGV